MKFLVDAQLPRRLTNFLLLKGHDARHTLDLPDQNYSSDSQNSQKPDCCTWLGLHNSLRRAAQAIA